MICPHCRRRVDGPEARAARLELARILVSLRATAAARALGVSRATAYRWRAELAGRASAPAKVTP